MTAPVTSADLVQRPDLGRSLEPDRIPLEQCIHRGAILRPNPGLDSPFAKERGHPTMPIKLPSQLNAFIYGILEVGGRAHMHRHTYESVIVILEGSGYSLIEGERLDWQAGDAIYTPRWAWHSHINSGTTEVRYLSITNMPMLANLGLMIREEPLAGAVAERDQNGAPA
ncbi:MAG: hypothetical protein GEEBNDBF_02402 [bacterium]|nr:hypothetical protein [bacterium]